VWEKYDAYCDMVRTKPPYNTGRLLLDLMDMAVFDFFTGGCQQAGFDVFSSA